MKTRKADELEIQIEDIELDEMTPKEMDALSKYLSPEGMETRKNRKKVRYNLYRCRSEAEGISKAGVTKEFRSLYEDQPMFGGWRFFAVTWDVAFDDPEKIINREHSEGDEWDALIRAKFPTISHDGRVSYPDKEVKNKVDGVGTQVKGKK